MTPRESADRMALVFLERGGPHTLPNPLEGEDEFCAALVFLGLKDRGLVSWTDFGHGNVQVAINDAGRKAIA